MWWPEWEGRDLGEAGRVRAKPQTAESIKKGLVNKYPGKKMK